MDYDRDRVDEVVMALLTLTQFRDSGGTRAWKGHSWEVMERLYERGWVGDPRGKAKSVLVTEEGEARARELFAKHFGRRDGHEARADTAGEEA